MRWAGTERAIVIDTYEIRRRIDDLKYRLNGKNKGLLAGAVAIAILIPAALIAWWVSPSAPVLASTADAARFREVSRSALDSPEGKADLAKLSEMKDADLLQELKTRQARLNEIDPGGKGETQEARTAWGALLRANSVNADRQRRNKKSDDE
ncbi:MAG TPA: hypothetical protein VK176_09840 [Phycisphaerales bacterium]|nr:hypothetical protein [Phycisphaerales bacterium]